MSGSYLLLLSFLIGMFGGLTRLALSSKAATSRTLTAFTMVGGGMATACTSILIVCTSPEDHFYLTFPASIVAGIAGETVLFLFLEFARKVSNKIISKLK